MKSFVLFLAFFFVARTGLATDLNLKDVLNQCKQLSGKDADQLKSAATVVTFGASWCHFCNELLPKNEALAEQYAGRVEFVEVDMGGSVLADAQQSAKSYAAISFYFNDPDTLTTPLGIAGYPTTVILDKTGKEVFNGIAEDDFNAYENVIKSVAK